MNKTKSILAAVAIAAAAASAQAAVFNTISGNFSGTTLPAGNIGSMFQVTGNSVTVNSLAFVDADGGGLTGSVTVGIYKYLPFGTAPTVGTSFDTTAQVSASISGVGSALGGNYVWQNVSPTVLTPGYYGLLISNAALGAGDNFGDNTFSDSLPSFPNSGGVVAFGGDIAGSVLGGAPSYATAYRFKLVNFDFTPVPEPETYAMIAGVGLVAFGLWRRRQ
jgi:hypothetical protein